MSLLFPTLSRAAIWWLVGWFAVITMNADSQTPFTSNLARSQEPQHAHTNRLIDETSPYLLQHAHNPVNWYPWGEEAFEKARREGKPIFLSVGYSTCYWCHVMEVESFEDDEVAAVLNEHFVAIKVDREERPDIDEQYMLATQLLTQRGGWPNSVWLTPEGKPWMAGTYFPKPRLIDALQQLVVFWRERRDDVERQADAIVEATERLNDAAALEAGDLTGELVDQAVVELTARFDPDQGGFGGAPKFPHHGTLQLFAHRFRDHADEKLLTPITKTLDAMWLGGIHDHIGGGFHRYSTDARWLLPHFEKMLYDNAQLVRAYADGHAITGEQRYRDAVEDIFTWVQREMTSPEGAFYSAIDSGEVGKEGEAYVWPLEALSRVLGDDDATLFAELYGFEARGNFTEEATGERPGTNIPHLDQPLDVTADERGEDADAFAERMATMRARLLTHRLTWPQPHKDDKVLTAWNGLMIGSLAHAGLELKEPRYVAAAARAADFILERMVQDDVLLRTSRGGDAKLHGYLDDYAYFIEGLIELHRATGEQRWLDQAKRFAATLLDGFQDHEKGGFFFTTNTHEDLIVRSKHLGAGGNTPSPNGVAADVLLRLSELTKQPEYAEAAKRALESMAGLARQQPFGNEHLLIATSRYLSQRIPEAKGVATTPAQASAADVSQRVGPVTVELYASRQHVAPGGSMMLAVVLNIDESWHLYADNPDAEFLVPTQVTIDAADALAIGDLRIPAAVSREDPVLKQAVNTYSGRVVYRIPMTVNPDAAAGKVTLRVTVKLQACDDERCLEPQTTVLPFTIEVDPKASGAVRHPQLFES